MNNLKTIIKNIFYPQKKYLVLLNGLTFLLLFIIFSHHMNHTIIAYVIYLFSAYSLIIDILAVSTKINKLKNILDQNSLYHRYNTDLAFKAEVSLYLSLGINIIYSVYKAFAGIYYHSLWFGTVAFYYIILSVERFLLLHHVRKKDNDEITLLKKYCLCGYLLFTLTIAIIGMSVYMIHEGEASTYPGHIIYAAAGYTFYSFISAIINSVKYRQSSNPMYHASKMITLSTALISVYSLQTSMFAAFGNDYMQQRLMNMTTGFVVFFVVICIALFMIIRGKKQLHKVMKTSSQ